MVLSTILLTGCAVNSGIVPMGQDTYFVTRQAATGFTGIGDLKADAFRQAYAFCKKRGEHLYVIHTREAKPPYIFGNFPKVEVRFACQRTNNTRIKRHELSKPSKTTISGTTTSKNHQ